MSSAVIKSVLLTDLTSTTANAVAAAFPNIFSSASQVPDYLYTSIKDFLGCAGSSDLDGHIVAALGEARTESEASIIIEQTSIAESVRDDRLFINSDAVGAETATYNITVRNVRTALSSALVASLGLRIRLLLDEQLRAQASQIINPILSTVDLPVNGDLSIDPNSPFKCMWLSSDLPKASQQVHTYRVVYKRIFI